MKLARSSRFFSLIFDISSSGSALAGKILSEKIFHSSPLQPSPQPRTFRKTIFNFKRMFKRKLKKEHCIVTFHWILTAFKTQNTSYEPKNIVFVLIMVTERHLVKQQSLKIKVHNFSTVKPTRLTKLIHVIYIFEYQTSWACKADNFCIIHARISKTCTEPRTFL